MYLTRKALSRRTLLQGAGAALTLPLLDAMVPAATALANTAAAPKPRMGFIYFPHGAVMNRWSPQEASVDFKISPILKPLDPFRSQMTIVSGLRNKGGESGDPHGIMAGTWLSCHGTQGREAGKELGVTADQFAARLFGADTPLASLEITGEGGATACGTGSVGCGFGGTTAFRTPFQPLPMENNPRKVFYQMFGRGDTAQERAAILADSGSVLDYVREATSQLNNTLGDADRARLGDYLDSVREVEQRVQKLTAATANSTVALPNAPLGIPEDFTELLDVHFELMALAYQSNQTRVASFMIAKESSMRSYNMVGVSDAFHPLSHHQNDATKLDRLVLIQNYHTVRFAKFIKRLAEMKDGDGSMLDHSIILYGSNMSNSDLHNNDPLPSVVMGRGCGRIKGGQHLQYPQDTPHANLLLTLLQRAGLPYESLGNSSGLLTEL
jgi:Protein of unknown function (DUF1552)